MKKVLCFCMCVCTFSVCGAELPACPGKLVLWPNATYNKSTCPAGTIELVAAAVTCKYASSADTCGMFVNADGESDAYTGSDSIGVFETSGFCAYLQ